MRRLTITLNIDIDDDRMMDADGHGDTAIHAVWICDPYGGHYQHQDMTDYQSRKGFLDTMSNAARDAIFKILDTYTWSEKDLARARQERERQRPRHLSYTTEELQRERDKFLEKNNK